MDRDESGEKPGGLSYLSWCAVLLAGFVVSSVSIALFVEGGLGSDVTRLRERREALREARVRNRRRHRALRRREKRLHQDPYLIEKLARERLGLSRPGEKRVRLAPQAAGDTPVLSPAPGASGR